MEDIVVSENPKMHYLLEQDAKDNIRRYGSFSTCLVNREGYLWQVALQLSVNRLFEPFAPVWHCIIPLSQGMQGETAKQPVEVCKKR